MNAKAKILIVDDEEVVRLSFVRTLARANWDVQAITGWSQISQVAKPEPFDLVLLDLRMPDADGITVLKAIKQRWAGCEVIVITGYGTLETAKQAMVLGAYDYLLKPVAPDQLIETCKAALQHKRWALQNEPQESNRREILLKLRLGCRAN